MLVKDPDFGEKVIIIPLSCTHCLDGRCRVALVKNFHLAKSSFRVSVGCRTLKTLKTLNSDKWTLKTLKKTIV